MVEENDKEKQVENTSKEKEQVVPEKVAPETTTQNMLDSAVKSREEDMKILDRKEELLKREEALEARRIMGGQSDGGQIEKKKSQDEKDQEEADRYLNTDGK